ncbi:MAG: sodium:solute symporter family transporter [Rubricella sp.]
MPSIDTLIGVCIGYVAFLFAVAFWAERRARRGDFGWLRSPLVYTLSISVYCTAWTYYGAVGSAARDGIEFVAIYLGPTLVFVGWWFVLRKLVRIARDQRTTSIADLISSRYGKSPLLGVVATLILIVAATPYIALQLQSLTVSFDVFRTDVEDGPGTSFNDVTALWMTIGLAAFAILFGTRNADVNERHYGVITAIAFEAIVKLVALTSVGLYVVFALADGPADIFARLPEGKFLDPEPFDARWATLVFLSATAVICLPRMFHVTVVENVNERHLATAGWAFPLYIFAISLFVLPIAIAGQSLSAAGDNPDLFVLTVPLAEGQNLLALVAFLGGFSAATSMVIVTAIALSTMVSNHIVLPIWLRIQGRRAQGADVRWVVLIARRLSIAGGMLLGYVYYRLTGGTDSLAAIGLIAFAGAAQLLPAIIAGIYWQGATRLGALVGIVSGFALWAYTLFLPSFEGAFILSPEVLANGPSGIGWLTPQAFFGRDFGDPLVHSMFWSLSANTALLVVISILGRPGVMEALQARLFVDVFSVTANRPGLSLQRTAKSEELFELAQKILGIERAGRIFDQIARAQGKPFGLPDPEPNLTSRLERELTGAIGAASAHAMVSQISGQGAVSVDELLRMADETAQIVEYTHQLEEKSRALTETASQLRRANDQLRAMGQQKDAFLSQVSHELRTPMTAIRSFADILRAGDLPPEQAQRFVSVIHSESERLTRLLDEILDMGVLESGRVSLHVEDVALSDVLAHAIAATEALMTQSGVTLKAPPVGSATVRADFDRLSQVFINVLSNAVKYGRGDPPRIDIHIEARGAWVHVDITDNGPGIAPRFREQVFEKFARLGESTLAGSAGLGLSISREIMRRLGGDIVILPRQTAQSGATFRITLQRVATLRAAE